MPITSSVSGFIKVSTESAIDTQELYIQRQSSFTDVNHKIEMKFWTSWESMSKHYGRIVISYLIFLKELHKTTTQVIYLYYFSIYLNSR